MRKWILPLALVSSLSACGMFGTGEMDQTGGISTGGGATNEVLEPTERTPAKWPTDQRPYMKNEQDQSSGSSGASGTEGQTSGASTPDAEVIIIEPVEPVPVVPVPSTGGASGMESSGNTGSSATESVTTGTSGASGSDTRESVERTPGEWPTDQRPYVNEQK